MLILNYNYVVSAYAEQPEGKWIDFGEKTEICGVEIIPQSDNRNIKLSIKLQGDDDQEVLNRAKKKIEHIILALFLSFDIPIILKNIMIESKVSISNEQIIITISDSIKLKESVYVSVKPNTECLSEILKIISRIESLPPDKIEKISRVLKWFYRATSEEDNIDCFVNLFIALEVISAFKHPEIRNFTKRSEKTLTDIFSDSKLAKKIVRIRCALLHEGEKDKDTTQYNPKLAEAILKGVKEIAGLT